MERRNPSIAYYVSAHGYGHGVRSCDIVNAINRLYPDLSVTVVTDLPVPFLRNRLASASNAFRPGSFDVGMVQRDSIRVDVPATWREVRALLERKDGLVEREAAFIREEGIAAVVADVPAIPLEAARRAGVPAVAVGNFSWDWIYSEFAETEPAWKPVVRQFEEGYALADLLLRLPFADEMKAFPRIEDIPLVASPGRDRRAELARLTGCRPGRKWVLLSFTSLELDEAALDRIEKLTDYEFFTVRPLEWRRRNIHPVNREQIPFSDVLASADAVVSKLGFGLMSECVVNGKPLVYADRSDFREYHVLVGGVKRCLKNVHVPRQNLYRGDLGAALEALWIAPEPPEKLAGGGAEVAAHRIARFL